jgi:hypothetical protein
VGRAAAVSAFAHECGGWRGSVAPLAVVDVWVWDCQRLVAPLAVVVACRGVGSGSPRVRGLWWGAGARGL